MTVFPIFLLNVLWTCACVRGSHMCRRCSCATVGKSRESALKVRDREIAYAEEVTEHSRHVPTPFKAVRNWKSLCK